MPGQLRNARAYPISLRQFTLENYRSATGHAANRRLASLEKSTYSVNPLSGRQSRAAIEKHFALVQNLWTVTLACGSLRKNAEELCGPSCGSARAYNLDIVRK
jgi:hypothetical protein